MDFEIWASGIAMITAIVALLFSGREVMEVRKDVKLLRRSVRSQERSIAEFQERIEKLSRSCVTTQALVTDGMSDIEDRVARLEHRYFKKNIETLNKTSS